MSTQADRRARLIARYGRTMTLTRGVASVALLGKFSGVAPGELTGGLQEGDTHLAITAREITAAGWPAPPRRGDRIVDNGTSWTVQGVERIMDRTTLSGWSLWLRGGGG